MDEVSPLMRFPLYQKFYHEKVYFLKKIPETKPCQNWRKSFLIGWLLMCSKKEEVLNGMKYFFKLMVTAFEFSVQDRPRVTISVGRPQSKIFTDHPFGNFWRIIFYRFILHSWTPVRKKWSGPGSEAILLKCRTNFGLRTGPKFGTNLDRNSYLVKSDYPCSSINEDELENMKAAPLFNWPISVELISPPASHWSKTIFKKPFYRAGINDSGIKRISKLAIQRDLPLNFVIALNNVYGLPSNDVIIDQENLKNKISDLLNDVEISNECIGTVR